jgi:prepilin-type N-terminal cleavage/methylation domain-containing protein
MKPTPPLRLRRAYTLVELLIVLAVLTTVDRLGGALVA